MFKTEEHSKYPVSKLKEIDLSDIPERDIKIMKIKIFIKSREQCVNKARFQQKDRKHKKQHTEITVLTNTITKKFHRVFEQQTR